MSIALFDYPKKAFFGKIIPKTKFYEHGNASSRLKDLFIKQVEQITWLYKLAPETINIPAIREVPEIQIFGIELKTPAFNFEVLNYIDDAIKFPVIFELNFEQNVQVVAAFKCHAYSDMNHWVTSEYFSTKWMPRDELKVPMPLALDLGSLYEQLLLRLIPYRLRDGEPFVELVARIERLHKKEKEFEKIARKLDKEKQFNRKVLINSQLRSIRKEIDNLVN